MFRRKSKEQAPAKKGDAARPDNAPAGAAAPSGKQASESHYGKLNVSTPRDALNEPAAYATLADLIEAGAVVSDGAGGSAYAVSTPLGPIAEAEQRGVEAWLRVSLSRGDAERILKKALDDGLPTGSYMLRQSADGSIGLSFVRKADGNLYHLKIMSERDPDGKLLFYIHGDREYGCVFSTVWELLNQYKTPTDRLAWHLGPCLPPERIPSQ